MASSSSTAIENYVAEFNGITEKLENGRDVCDLMTGFWEKLAKAEHAYAKQLEDLCKGRYARLETLLGQTKIMLTGAEKPSQPASLEHIGSLQDCWVKVVGEVQKLASEHNTLGTHITSKVTPTITKFVKEKVKDEMAKAATGKRLLTDAKTGYQRVTATKRKYFSDTAAAVAKSTGDGEEEAVEPPSKMAYQAAVDDLTAKHDEIFSVGLPGVLKDINVIEQDRAHMLCSCMNQYTRAAAALQNALTFDETAAALEATTKDPAVTQLVMMTPPPPKPAVEEATEEAIAQDQEEAQATSLISAMSGWLKRAPPAESSSSKEADSEPAAAEKEEAKAEPSPASSEPSAASKITSFFSGWGRKSKPAPATEPIVDAPGLVDSTDGGDETAAAADSENPDTGDEPIEAALQAVDEPMDDAEQKDETGAESAPAEGTVSGAED